MIPLLSFVNLLNAWWGLLVIPIFLLYLMRIKIRRQQVSTLQFWGNIFEEKPPRALTGEFRHWFSFLLQLLFLALLVLALTEPSWNQNSGQPRQLLILLDNSASMQTHADGSTRIQLAQDTAHSLIQAMRDIDQASLLLLQAQPTVACGWTEQPRLLLHALDSIAPTPQTGNVTAAFEAAERLCQNYPQAEIHFFTDGCFSLPLEVTPPANLRWHLVGTRQVNTAITRFEVRRNPFDTLSYQVLIELLNTSEETLNTRLELTLDEQLIDVIPLNVPANSRWSREVNYQGTQGGTLNLEMKHSDALEIDNQASTLLPKVETRQVLLVTDGSLYLENALRSLPFVELTVAKELPAQTEPYKQLVVLHKKNIPSIPAGNFIFINPTGTNELWNSDEINGDGLIAKQNLQHPIFQHVKLENVIVPSPRPLQFSNTEPGTSLLSGTSEEVLACIWERDQGKVIVFSFESEQGEFPLRLAFPILMKNSVEWIYLDRTGSLAKTESTSIAASSNPLSSEESNLTQRLPPSVINSSPLEASIATYPIWMILTLLAIVLTVTEWALYQRRVIA